MRCLAGERVVAAHDEHELHAAIRHDRQVFGADVVGEDADVGVACRDSAHDVVAVMLVDSHGHFGMGVDERLQIVGERRDET